MELPRTLWKLGRLLRSSTNPNILGNCSQGWHLKGWSIYSVKVHPARTNHHPEDRRWLERPLQQSRRFSKRMKDPAFEKHQKSLNWALVLFGEYWKQSWNGKPTDFDKHSTWMLLTWNPVFWPADFGFNSRRRGFRTLFRLMRRCSFSLSNLTGKTITCGLLFVRSKSLSETRRRLRSAWFGLVWYMTYAFLLFGFKKILTVKSTWTSLRTLSGLL